MLHDHAASKLVGLPELCIVPDDARLIRRIRILCQSCGKCMLPGDAASPLQIGFGCKDHELQEHRNLPSSDKVGQCMPQVTTVLQKLHPTEHCGHTDLPWWIAAKSSASAVGQSWRQTSSSSLHARHTLASLLTTLRHQLSNQSSHSAIAGIHGKGSFEVCLVWSSSDCIWSCCRLLWQGLANPKHEQPCLLTDNLEPALHQEAHWCMSSCTAQSD